MIMSYCSSVFFFSSRRRHTRWPRDWSSDVCSSDLAIDAAAHRDRDASRLRGGPEDRPERVRERVDRELVAPDGRRLQQRQPFERPLEPFRLGADDPLALDGQAHERPAAVARGVANRFDHEARLAIARVAVDGHNVYGSARTLESAAAPVVS